MVGASKGTKPDKKTVVLLDAHAIIHRAYHALPDFSSSQGEPTGALYGILSMLVKIFQELKPDYVIACYDLPEKTFRHHAFEGYKAHREKADDSLVRQIETSREIFGAFHIPIYEAPGFEADDIIGTITNQLKKQPAIRVVIATGDMDTLQLVSGKQITVYTLKKGINDMIVYDEEGVKNRFGFSPQYIPDYKGLRGDPSDNIPGVKGIGEKTGGELIKEFKTVENLYDILEKKPEKVTRVVKERIAQLLRDHHEEALFSKTLATIRVDAPISFQLPQVSFLDNASFSQIEPLLEKFEFRSLIPRLKKFFNQGDDHDDTLEETTGSPEEVLRLGIMVWLLDSNKTSLGESEILSYTKKKALHEAETYLKEELSKEGLTRVFEEIEEPIISCVMKMSSYGIGIDRDYFQKLHDQYHRELESLEKEIKNEAGVSFNLNSPKQLAEVLFEKLKLPSKGSRGKAGSFSTKSEILEELAETHAIAQKILEYREIQKLLSTYIEAIPKLVGDDGRLHPTFLQHGTVTGRFSSENPNVQNIPIKSERGRAIRKGIISGPDHTFVACDYSQIELRVAAILSKDEKLITIFREGKDVHAGVAALVFRVPEDKVDYEMRRKAKIINFGMLYGMGVRALRKQLGTSLEEAQEFLNTYRTTFTTLHTYMESVIEDAKKKGYTETLFGRRRPFTALRSPLPHIRAQAERMAVNAPIQGTSADMIKLAIRFVDEDLRRTGFAEKVHLVLQIHDELVYEVEESVAEEALRMIKNGMEGVLKRSFLDYTSPVPITVSGDIGKHLGEL